VTRPVLQTEGAAGHRQPCRGPSVCTAHGGHDFARRLMLVRGKHQTWGAPASRRVFSAARGGAGLAANHNSLAANSKIGGNRTP